MLVEENERLKDELEYQLRIIEELRQENILLKGRNSLEDSQQAIEEEDSAEEEGNTFLTSFITQSPESKTNN